MSDALLYLAKAAAPDHGTNALRAALLKAIPRDADADADLVAFVLDPEKGEDTRYQLVKDLRTTIVAPVIAAVRADLPDGVRLHGPDAMTPTEQQAAQARYLELVEGWPDSPAWQEGRRVLTRNPEHGWTECSLEIPSQPWDPATVEALATRPASATERHGHTLSSWDAAVLDTWANLRTDELAKHAEACAKLWADGSWLDRWVPQDGKPPKWLVAAALAYWQGPGKATAQAKYKAHRLPAALQIDVHSLLGDSLVPNRSIGDTAVHRVSGDQLPLFPAASAASLERLNFQVLNTLDAWRLLTGLVTAASEAHHVAHGTRSELATWPGVVALRNATGVELFVPGGMRGLASLVGANTSNQSQDRLKDALNVLAHTKGRLPWGSDEGCIHLLEWQPKDPHIVYIRVSDALCPGYTFTAKRAGQDPRIVPVPGTIPPMPTGVHERSQSLLVSLDWLATNEMVRQQQDALSHGGVLLPLRELERRAGFTRKTRKYILEALDYWSTPQDGEPSRWVNPSPGRYFLSLEHPETKHRAQYILEHARTVIRSRKGGENSRNVKKRRRK